MRGRIAAIVVVVVELVAVVLSPSSAGRVAAFWKALVVGEARARSGAVRSAGVVPHELLSEM